MIQSKQKGVYLAIGQYSKFEQDKTYTRAKPIAEAHACGNTPDS